MRSLILALCTAVVVLLPYRAAAQDPAHAVDSPRVTITVDNPTLVGDTMIKPGQYKFQCKHVDGKSFLVVSSSENNKEVARVPCTQEAMPQKIENSELHAIVRADGLRSLQSVRIKGETIAHRIAN
jgi:hypothetical protein